MNPCEKTEYIVATYWRDSLGAVVPCRLLAGPFSDRNDALAVSGDDPSRRVFGVTTCTNGDDPEAVSCEVQE